MSKDDYHVIIYQILSYLYHCLKSGKAVEPGKLKPDSVYFTANGQSINIGYWAYIIYHLQRGGYIEGVVFTDMDNLSVPYPADLDGCMITPEGIEYLTDNSFLAKAREFLKETKAIVPFV